MAHLLETLIQLKLIHIIVCRPNKGGAIKMPQMAQKPGSVNLYLCKQAENSTALERYIRKRQRLYAHVLLTTVYNQILLIFMLKE